MTASWRPSATLDTLRARAQVLAQTRRFFADRAVLEVDTPALSQHACVDRHIDSYAVAGGGWLHTSPEFAMKRLLAAGSGPIFQLCHVFRAEAAGPHHNPEFMMLEWYRPGWDHRQLMLELEALLQALGPFKAAAFAQRTYRDAFHQRTGLDPHHCSLQALQDGLEQHRIALPALPAALQSERTVWLDLWMGAVVGPQLGLDQPLFVVDYPASQAALARIRPGTPPVAERFELYWKGQELANGFHELTDADEQRQRFTADLAWRKSQQQAEPPMDAHLLAALAAGMPQGAGVAVGMDRLIQLLLGLPSLDQVLSFAADRA